MGGSRAQRNSSLPKQASGLCDLHDCTCVCWGAYVSERVNGTVAKTFGDPLPIFHLDDPLPLPNLDDP